MFFKEGNHKDLYFRMLANVPKSNREYDLCCYVLSAIGKAGMLSYMGDGIGIDDMLKNIDFSSGEKVLLKVAGSLFNGRVCDINEFSRLDEENLTVVIEALKLKYLTAI